MPTNESCNNSTSLKKRKTPSSVTSLRVLSGFTKQQKGNKVLFCMYSSNISASEISTSSWPKRLIQSTVISQSVLRTSGNYRKNAGRRSHLLIQGIRWSWDRSTYFTARDSSHGLELQMLSAVETWRVTFDFQDNISMYRNTSISSDKTFSACKL